MKKLRKLCAVLLSLSLITAFSACNYDAPKPDNPNNPVNPADPDDPDDPTDPENPGEDSDTLTIMFGKTKDSSASYTQIVKKGVATQLKANTITYDGYRFAGWMSPITGGLSSVSSSVYSVSYLDKSYIKLTSGYGTNGDLYPLIAAWVADDVDCYTITFDSNDGTGKKYTQYYPKSTGKSTFYIAYNPFVRKGYTFAGWTTHKDSTTHFGEIDDHAKFNFEDDTTLYAVWQEDSKIYVQFNANDETDNPEFYEKEFDRNGEDTVINLVLDENKFTRDNYVFTTWKCGNVSYYGGIEYKIKDSVKLNATWCKESDAYDITYHANYIAEGADEEEIYTYYVQKGSWLSSVSIKLRANTFVREGYIFKGWCSFKDYDTIHYYDQQNFNADRTGITLYALWSPEENSSITITYNANDGTDEPETKNVSVTAYEGYTLPENPFTREGWTFAGWYYKPGPIEYTDCWKSGTDINGSIVDSINSKTTSTWFTQDTTWYAIWTKKNCELNLHNNYGDDEITVLTYEANKTLYNVARPEREGYKFEGWASTPDAENYEWYSNFLSDKEEETAYAVWNKYYTVTFDANGGEGTTVTEKYTKTGSSNSVYLDYKAYTKEGYKLVGWNTKADGTGEILYSNRLYVSKMEELGLEGDFTLYAYWEKIYTITYDPNGADGDPVKRKFCLSDNYITTLDKTTFNRDGFSFKEWNTMPDGSGNCCDKRIFQEDYTKLGITGDFTLYAIWNEK